MLLGKIALDSSHTLSVRYLDIALEQLFVTPLYTNVFYHDSDLIHSDLRQSVLHVANTPNAVALKTTYLMPDGDAAGRLQAEVALGKVLLVADDSLFLCLSLLNKVVSLTTPYFSATSDASAGAGVVSVPVVTGGVPTVPAATASTASTAIPPIPSLSTPPSSPPQRALFPITPLLSPNSLHVASQVVESFSPLDLRKTSAANAHTPTEKEENLSPIQEEPHTPKTLPRESSYGDVEVEIRSSGVELSMYRLLNSTLFVKGRRDDASLLFHFSFVSGISLTKSGGSTTISMDVNDAGIELGSKDDARVLLSKEMSEVSGGEESALIHLCIHNKSDVRVDLNQLAICLDAPAVVDSLTAILGVALLPSPHA